MIDDILTIEEVAQYLRVSDRTVYDWAQKGEIPAGKIGTVWRFKKSEIERWVNARLSTELFTDQNSDVKERDILSADRVVFVEHTSKHDALIQLCEVLSNAPQIKNAAELTTSILNREELMSTSIGKGIAIPHVRLASVTDLVMAVGICKKPISDWQTFDDQKVNLIFMIAAAYNQHSYYLKTISHFSAKLRQDDLRDRLINSSSVDEAYSLLIKK